MRGCPVPPTAPASSTSPEAAVGGPLALVRTGDPIAVDVEARRLDLVVDEAELDRRRAAWRPKPLPPRGYGRMFAAHIAQAHEGCDFDFLLGTEPLPEPEIHWRPMSAAGSTGGEAGPILDLPLPVRGRRVRPAPVRRPVTGAIRRRGCCGNPGRSSR